MQKTLWLSALGAALISTTAAFAQETTSDEAPAASTPALSLGEDVVDGPRAGDRYTKEEFGDWSLRCIFTGTDEEDPCTLYQLLSDADANPVAEISLFRLAEGGEAVAGANIITPLETLLTQQVTLQVDGGAAKRYPFQFCSPVGCVARVGLTAEDIAAFKRGAKGVMTMVPAGAPDQRVDVEISLSGFTAGYEATSVTKN